MNMGPGYVLVSRCWVWEIEASDGRDTTELEVLVSLAAAFSLVQLRGTLDMHFSWQL